MLSDGQQPTTSSQGICPIPPAKTLQEEKELHFSEEQLKAAKQHSNAFLEVVKSNAERPPYHGDYTLVVLGVDPDQHYLHSLWRAANIRILPEHALQEVDKLLAEVSQVKARVLASDTTYLTAIIHNFPLSQGSKDRFPPETIIGELKEIEPNLLQTYQQKYKVKPTSSTDENLTDAEKCLEYLKVRGEKHDGEMGTVVLYGRDKPRVDKLLSVMHAMHKVSTTRVPTLL